MTKTKAIKILQQHGFEISAAPTARSYLSVIRHPATGSHIHGRIYEDALRINTTLKDYKVVWFNFGEGSSSTELARVVESLEDELNHYDEILRHEKIENVKKYFRDRKYAEEIV